MSENLRKDTEQMLHSTMFNWFQEVVKVVLKNRSVQQQKYNIIYLDLPSMKELPPLPSRITNRPGYSNSDLNQIDINIMVDSSKPQARPTSRFG